MLWSDWWKRGRNGQTHESETRTWYQGPMHLVFYRLWSLEAALILKCSFSQKWIAKMALILGQWVAFDHLVRHFEFDGIWCFDGDVFQLAQIHRGSAGLIDASDHIRRSARLAWRGGKRRKGGKRIKSERAPLAGYQCIHPFNFSWSWLICRVNACFWQNFHNMLSIGKTMKSDYQITTHFLLFPNIFFSV